jgi:FkbM family methyltransferase
MFRNFLLNYYVKGLHRLAPVLGKAYAQNCIRDTGMGARMRFHLTEPNEIHSLFHFADDLWVRTWKQYLTAGDGFLDVGANAGFYCTHLAKHVGATGKVVAVEPNPKMISRLNESKDLNALQNLTVISAAASEFTGQSVLLVGSDHGLTRLDADRQLITGIEVVDRRPVPVVKLDSLAAEFDTSRLRGIKLDIEGHEYKALLGARSLLTTFRPLVQMEFNVSLMGQYGVSPGDLYTLFEDLDYRFFVVIFPSSPWFHKSRVTLKQLRPTESDKALTDVWVCPRECENRLLRAWQSNTRFAER